MLAKSKAPEIEPFAVGVEKGKPNYQSILIANVDGPVKELKDVKGHPFAFGDQASTSSHLAPRAHLAKNGLIGDVDYKVVHLGKHDAVARAVAAGQVPVGALSEPIFRTLVDGGKIDASKVRQIALSDAIPNYPMTVQGYLKPDLKAAIKKSFLDLKDPTILKLFRVEGLAVATDKDYDVLRDMARILQLDIAKL